MAKQIAGLCFLVGTFDDLTFYKMDGQYYARAKSSLSAERVKTGAEFKRTMVLAELLVRASRIGSQIYKALPPGWRQFWMYRSFTGEALMLLKENPYSDEEVKALLWQCYVEYWEQRRVVDPANPIWQPKPKKVRKRRKYSDESIQRLLKRKDKNGRLRWRDPEEEERKRQHKAMNAACYERTMEKQRRLAEEERRAKDPGIVMQGFKLRISEPRRALSIPQLRRAPSKPGSVLKTRPFLCITVSSTLHATADIPEAVASIEDG